MDPSRLKRVAADFGTPIIGHDDQFAFYGRMHLGGPEKARDRFGCLDLNLAGVWQFVGHPPPSDASGLTETRIAQWVVPRFTMAAALDEVSRLIIRRPNNRPLVHALAAGLALVVREDESLAFGIRSEGRSWMTPLPRETRSLLASDVRLLDDARAAVVSKGKHFRLPGPRTPGGHEVASTSRQAIEAISFEKAASNRLTHRTFGVYTAYCVQRDSKPGATTTDRYVDNLVDGLELLAPEQAGKRYAAVCTDVQTALFRKPIWGCQNRVRRDTVHTALGDALRALTIPQRVQFTLLQDMNPANVLLHLGFVTGHVKLGQLTDFVAACHAPDSPQERYIRTKLAFITLYGTVS